MDGISIYPTGDCFEDATWIFAKMMRGNSKLRQSKDFFVVHAICKMSDGRPYSHAWVRLGDSVFFGGYTDAEKKHKVVCKADWEEYRVSVDVVEYTEYSIWDLVEIAKTRGNEPPPWEDKYRRLCNGESNG